MVMFNLFQFNFKIVNIAALLFLYKIEIRIVECKKYLLHPSWDGNTDWYGGYVKETSQKLAQFVLTTKNTVTARYRDQIDKDLKRHSRYFALNHHKNKTYFSKTTQRPLSPSGRTSYREPDWNIWTFEQSQNTDENIQKSTRFILVDGRKYGQHDILDRFSASSDNMTSLESNADFFAVKPDDKDDFVFPNFSFIFHSKMDQPQSMGYQEPIFKASTSVPEYTDLELEFSSKKARKHRTKQPSLLNSYYIAKEIHDIASNFKNTTVITEEVIGQTTEFRDIVLLKISSKLGRKQFRTDKDKYVNDDPEKKIVFIVHGLSVMGFKYVPHLSRKMKLIELISTYIRKGTNDFDIFLIPMANPDGVQKSITKKYWNKNVSPQSACPGVALDRNFDVAWKSRPQNISSCSQQYHGPESFSERESRAVRDVFRRHGNRIVAYFHVHAGTYDHTVFKGDAVLYPKGYTDEAISYIDQYTDLKGKIEEGIRNLNFKVMSVAVDTLYNWYGPVTGTSVDYASTVYGVPYAMEFVMQVFKDGVKPKKSDEEYSKTAFSKIWQMIIATVFQHIHDEETLNNQVS